MAPTIPREETGDTETLATGADAAELDLVRGQYRTSFTVAADADPATVENETRRLKIGEERKRVHFYKVDAIPTGEKSDEGEPLVKVTTVFRVIDNPLPLAPIAWGAAALVGAGGGSWILFSSAEGFVEEAGPTILTAAAAIFSIMVGYHTLFAT